MTDKVIVNYYTPNDPRLLGDDLSADLGYLTPEEEARHAPAGAAEARQEARAEPIQPLDLAELARIEPPARRYAWTDWLAIGTVTALYGPPGGGKSLLAQHLATATALGRDFLGAPTDGRPVLAIFAEEDQAELWRRQVALARALALDLAALDRRLFLVGRAGLTNVLAERRFGRLEPGPFLDVLREACAKLRPGLVILDNIAQVFAGDENDRSEVSRFVNMMTGLALEYDCAVLLVGHIAKAEGSEYSGSTAWSAAVRSRWLLQRRPEKARKDKPKTGDAAPGKAAGRLFLSRLKSNYAPPAELELVIQAGAFYLAAEEPRDRLADELRRRRAMQCILDGLETLRRRGIVTAASRRAGNFAPRLLEEHGLVTDPERPAEPFALEDLATAMLALLEEGRLHADVRVRRRADRKWSHGLGPPEWNTAAEEPEPTEEPEEPRHGAPTGPRHGAPTGPRHGSDPGADPGADPETEPGAGFAPEPVADGSPAHAR